jgi:hypothetical protein
LIPASNELVRFYNPRTDRWREHFRLSGVVIEPLTEIGEATIRILQMNHDDQILERQVLNVRGRYPGQASWLLITDDNGTLNEGDVLMSSQPGSSLDRSAFLTV